MSRRTVQVHTVVVANSREVDVDGRHFACGDFGDMPVLGSGPGAGVRLGLNVDLLVR